MSRRSGAFAVESPGDKRGLRLASGILLSGGLAKGSLDSHQAGEAGGKGPIRMMFNTPTWHATGVINDIPNPSQSQDSAASRFAASQSRLGSLAATDLGNRGSHASSPDTVRALELALREVLDNIKAATYVSFLASY